MLNPPFGNTVNAIAPTIVPRQSQRNGCAAQLRGSVGDDAGRRSARGDRLSATGRAGARCRGRTSTFPQQGVYVSMPIDADADAGDQWNLSYQRQFLAHMMFDVTYMGNKHRPHLVPGYEENPSIYIPGQLRRGPVRADGGGPCSNTTTANRQARSLLTLLNPTEGKYYAANNVAQAYLTTRRGTTTACGSACRSASATAGARTPTTRSASASTRASRRTDIGNAFPVPLDRHPYSHPASGHVDERRAVRRGSPAQLQPVGGARQPRPRLAASSMRITKDWQTGIIWQARSGQPDHADDDRRLRADERPAAADASCRASIRTSPADQRTWATTGSTQSHRVVQPGGVRAEHARTCGATRRRAT